jgi:hypothetical protein
MILGYYQGVRMSGVLNSGRQFKSDDIVNGLARIDILDRKGGVLVKKGSRVNEVQYQRMREEGLLPYQDNTAKSSPNKSHIDYSSPDSVHSRLNWLIMTFSAFQKQIISKPDARLQEELKYLSKKLKKLSDENIYQVLGELHLAEAKFYSFIKPLYIAASLNELVKRYNQYNPSNLITEEKNLNLIQAALLHNLGLLNSQYNVYSSQEILTSDQRNEIRRNYPRASVAMAKKIGVTTKDILETIEKHNTESGQSSFEAQLLRMPFVYAGIAMRERNNRESMDIINPTRHFASLFAEGKLDPILGGLFLRINGLAPVGSILLFDSREKALIISGPNEINIASSVLRLITNKNGVQLGRPGEKFRLDRTSLVQKGMSDHHQFAWNKFSPFAAWEK